jgi:hypothetical protein
VSTNFKPELENEQQNRHQRPSGRAKWPIIVVGVIVVYLAFVAPAASPDLRAWIFPATGAAVSVRDPAPELVEEPFVSDACDVNYDGVCVPIAADVDCDPGSGDGPEWVQGPVVVVGVDIYDLDRDGDGVGCD